MRLSFHGADKDVTGSCHLIECAGKRVLIDCGFFQGSGNIVEQNAADFGFDPAGRVCLDLGASTGGFTDVLLARGARRVYAVDVGRDQLHPRLRARPEIVSMEETDIRKLDPAWLAERPQFVCIDVSFISLKLVLPAAVSLAQFPAGLLALIKPQFEAGRGELKKGIARNPDVHRAVCNDIAARIASLGWKVAGVVPSAITGGDGNREFFIGASHE